MEEEYEYLDEQNQQQQIQNRGFIQCHKKLNHSRINYFCTDNQCDNNIILEPLCEQCVDENVHNKKNHVVQPIKIVMEDLINQIQAFKEQFIFDHQLVKEIKLQINVLQQFQSILQQAIEQLNNILKEYLSLNQFMINYNKLTQLINQIQTETQYNEMFIQKIKLQQYITIIDNKVNLIYINQIDKINIEIDNIKTKIYQGQIKNLQEEISKLWASEKQIQPIKQINIKQILQPNQIDQNLENSLVSPLIKFKKSKSSSNKIESKPQLKKRLSSQQQFQYKQTQKVIPIFGSQQSLDNYQNNQTDVICNRIDNKELDVTNFKGTIIDAIHDNNFIWAVLLLNDNQHLVYSDAKKRIVIYDLQKKKVNKILSGYNKPIWTIIQISKQLILTNTQQDTLVLWNWMTGQTLKRLPVDIYEQSGLYQLYNNNLIFGNNENCVTILSNWINNKQEIKFKGMNFYRIIGICQIKDNVLITAQDSQAFKVWDITKWIIIKEIDLDDLFKAFCKINENLFAVAAGSYNKGFISLFNTSDFSKLVYLELKYSMSNIIRINKNIIAIAPLQNNVIQFWDWKINQFLNKISGPNAQVLDIKILDQHTLLTNFYGKLILWR